MLVNVGEVLTLRDNGIGDDFALVSVRPELSGWDGAAIFGDSGSPVRVTDLKAAGNLTHLVVDTTWLPSFIAGTRIVRIRQLVEGWSLASSSICP